LENNKLNKTQGLKIGRYRRKRIKKWNRVFGISGLLKL